MTSGPATNAPVDIAGTPEQGALAALANAALAAKDRARLADQQRDRERRELLDFCPWQLQ